MRRFFNARRLTRNRDYPISWILGFAPCVASPKARSSRAIIFPKNMQIFIDQNGQQAGPFSVEAVRGMIAARSIAPTDLGWHAGLSDWQPLNTFLPNPEGSVVVNAKPSRMQTLGRCLGRWYWNSIGRQPVAVQVIGCLLGLFLLSLLGEALMGVKRGGAGHSGSSRVTEEQRKNAVRIAGKVFQVVKEGMIVKIALLQPEWEKGRAHLLLGGEDFVFVAGHPRQDTKVDGDYIDVDAVRDGMFSYTNTIGGGKRLAKYQVIE